MNIRLIRGRRILRDDGGGEIGLHPHTELFVEVAGKGLYPISFLTSVPAMRLQDVEQADDDRDPYTVRSNV